MSLGLFAQVKETLIKGRLNLENGTSHQGYFKRQSLEDIRNGVVFKKELTDNSEYYKVADIKEAKFETGEIFRTVSCLNIANQNQETFLASLMVDGQASLYESMYEGDFIYVLSKEGEYVWLQDDKIVDNELKKFYFRNKLAVLLSSDKISYASFGSIDFNDKDLINVVSLYNNQSSSKNIVVQKNVEKLRYLIIGVAGMYKNNNEQEYNASAIYRSYFPAISQSTSLNMGLNYYYNIYMSNGYKFRRQLYTLPLFLRQNILKKSIRPYIDLGLNLSYVQENFFGTNQSSISSGFQKNYGLGFLVGAGVEADISKQYQIKTEYKFENYKHMLMIGFARVIEF